MTDSENNSKREEKAVQALISAALHVRDLELTADEIRPYVAKEVHIADADEAALRRIGAKPLSKSTPLAQQQVEQAVGCDEFMALHRKKPGQGFSQKTEDEIKRKREELLAKLKNKKGRN